LLTIEFQPTNAGKQLGVTAEHLNLGYDLLERSIEETTPQRGWPTNTIR
jgi:hypothetical protein